MSGDSSHTAETQTVSKPQALNSGSHVFCLLLVLAHEGMSNRITCTILDTHDKKNSSQMVTFAPAPLGDTTPSGISRNSPPSGME